jgi:hypothetical protein
MLTFAIENTNQPVLGIGKKTACIVSGWMGCLRTPTDVRSANRNAPEDIYGGF